MILAPFSRAVPSSGGLSDACPSRKRELQFSRRRTLLLPTEPRVSQQPHGPDRRDPQMLVPARRHTCFGDIVILGIGAIPCLRPLGDSPSFERAGRRRLDRAREAARRGPRACAFISIGSRGSLPGACACRAGTGNRSRPSGALLACLIHGVVGAGDEISQSIACPELREPDREDRVLGCGQIRAHEREARRRICQAHVE